MKHVQTLLCVGVFLIFATSCQQASKNEERNKALIFKANDELFGKGNLAFADEIFTPDFTFPGFSEKGPALIKGYVAELRKAFPDLQYKIEITVVEGDYVAWKRTHTGTHRGDFMGYKATNKPVSWQEFTITRFTEDGKIAEEPGSTDFEANLQRASGVEGVYEYVAPLKGQAINHNGRFAYLYPNGTAQGGTYTVDGEIITNTFTSSTNLKEVGTSFTWKMKSWAGDTATFAILDKEGKEQSEGRAVRVSW